ncbi:MAG: hypothetical protein A2682_03525 [Candidatus Terrybacteria bacterium RIFCSPHIGHO2_01_FULL_58_15]|uniref:NYN domain-containing protein n=1 Tax=Terrybacteria sp. (strain RIFCSPHIGHO2_01_FULL_58_15) TaxID=1802363 RepID=A0A1G2PML3_TERXR|nr:MAG: hypothetical protein A2682_03525 [Candidatus Terrybacteria bacterium RIFCSPHIGHO2_01_FULL_58_15]
MSVIRHPSQRVAVFVDVSNLYHSAKHLFVARVNFKALLESAVAGRHLVRSLAYVVRAGEAEEQAFFDALTKAEFEVKMKDLQIFAGGTKKGDWDIGIAVDAIRLAPNLDVIVLATGDGDFVPLVEYLKLHFGIQVELMAFGRSAALRLRETVDDVTDLGDPKFLIRIRRAQGRARPAPASTRPREGSSA